jgi:hypothetical protein
MSIVNLEVQTAPGFFVEGPTKKVVVVFVGQKSVIPIRFLPLTAGEMTLPTITLSYSDVGQGGKTKSLLAPIVITYTS